jgi:hypothetical protein
MAYLALLPSNNSTADFKQDFLKNSVQLDSAVMEYVVAFAQTVKADTRGDFYVDLQAYVEEKLDASSDEMFDQWDEAALFVDSENRRTEVFKQPEVLRYMEDLQVALLESDIVGKSNSLADVVKTVHREMLLGEAEQFRIPDTISAVAQTLLSYQNSHRPYDLWHLVTPDYTKSTIWVQLKSGDNVDMSKVIEMVDAYVASHPLPADLEHKWYGLTYINVIWQDRMVSGMMDALIGSFVVVLLMMIVLFRSVLWGLLSMAPLTISVGLIYGIVGLVGKDYDMPVAVLSSLALGLAIDYAIHFLVRSRDAMEQHGSWAAAIDSMFGEPARAISRNAVVLGVGFLPLLLAPLIPYNTVGVLIASILVIAGLATLLILPALITVLEPWLFKKNKGA